MVSSRVAAIAALSALAGAGCVDLAEPIIPSLGAPAVFNVTIRQIPGLPIDVSGTLSAGRETSGFRRQVLTPLIAINQPIVLGEPTAQGIFLISAQVPPPASDFIGPFEVQPPLIDGLPAPPTFRWFGIRTTDPAVIETDSAGDVTLHVQSELGAADPANRSRQWFLELRGDAGSIRVSGDGPPPPVLRIPSQFIPPAPDRQVEAFLIYFQSATISQAPVTYIASVTLDVRLQWIIRLH
jgi:hypothetical protein